MTDRYILVLVSLNPDGTDIGGHQYPDFGFFEAEKFQPDERIENGLYGSLNGTGTKWLTEGKTARVIRVERSHEIILLDKEDELVKFRRGVIVHSGDLQRCREFLATELKAKGKHLQTVTDALTPNRE